MRSQTRHTEKKKDVEVLYQPEQVESENRTLVLETAGRVALDILASETGVEALKHIAEAARTLAGAQYAALGVARPDGNGLLEFVTVGLTAEQEAAIGPRPAGKGVLGHLLHLHEPLHIDLLADHPSSVGFPAGHPEMDTFLGVPIRRGETILGSLYLTNKQGGGTFTLADELAVQSLGAHAAVAINNLLMLNRQRALVSGLMMAQEEERRAVAYELHDGLTQYVMASHAHMEAFKRAHASGSAEKAERELQQGMTYLKEAVVESRRLVSGLRSLALDDLGLAGALEQLLNEEKVRAPWTSADLIHNVADHRFDKALETAVYRVAQEALTNVRKHAESPRVRLSLLAEESRLILEVRDWGKGFNPDDLSRDYAHVGLQGMQERITLMGGQFDIRSSPGSGTLIHAEFPLSIANPMQDGGAAS